MDVLSTLNYNNGDLHSPPYPAKPVSRKARLQTITRSPQGSTLHSPRGKHRLPTYGNLWEPDNEPCRSHPARKAPTSSPRIRIRTVHPGCEQIYPCTIRVELTASDKKSPETKNFRSISMAIYSDIWAYDYYLIVTMVAPKPYSRKEAS